MGINCINSNLCGKHTGSAAATINCMQRTFPIALKVKAKHGILQKFIDEKGWTQAELARVVGVGNATVGRWFNLQDFPKSPESMDKICRLLSMVPEDIFPEFIRNPEFLALKKETIQYREIDLEFLPYNSRELREIEYEGNSPEDEYLLTETRDNIKTALRALSPREEEILRMRFGLGTEREHTLDEVGKHFSLHRERVRQIEALALSKLRRRSQRRPNENGRPHIDAMRALKEIYAGHPLPAEPSEKASDIGKILKSISLPVLMGSYPIKKLNAYATEILPFHIISTLKKNSIEDISELSGKTKSDLRELLCWPRYDMVSQRFIRHIATLMGIISNMETEIGVSLTMKKFTTSSGLTFPYLGFACPLHGEPVKMIAAGTALPSHIILKLRELGVKDLSELSGRPVDCFCGPQNTYSKTGLSLQSAEMIAYAMKILAPEHDLVVRTTLR